MKKLDKTFLIVLKLKLLFILVEMTKPLFSIRQKGFPHMPECFLFKCKCRIF